MAAYEAAENEAARRRAYAKLADVLRSQLQPTWQLMWRGVELLRELPVGASVERRWAADRDAYTVPPGAFPEETPWTHGVRPLTSMTAIRPRTGPEIRSGWHAEICVAHPGC